jgi:hypothetical protein
MASRLNDVLRRYGAEIVRADVQYKEQRVRIDKRWWNNGTLPDDAVSCLKADNPKLIDLQRRYEACDPDVTTPFVWAGRHLRPEDIVYFRGHNAWVLQVRRRGKGVDDFAYAITLYYLKSIDRLGLLDTLGEDESFGNFTFTIAGRQVSRDLLDSLAEIYFLDRHLEVSSREGFRVLDVGAGYGRLAHRMANALPGIESIFCTDAVAVSTFVSDYYLRFRGVEKARVIPLDEIDNALSEHPVDLAINIHSFSECRPQAIEWLTVSLKTPPLICGLRGLGLERGPHAKVSIQRSSNRRDPQGAQGRFERGRPVPQTWHQHGDALQLAREIRRPRDERSGASQAA